MFHVPETFRVSGSPAFGNNGAFVMPAPFGHGLAPSSLRIIASDGAGWEHVSISLRDRCPTWDEMCWVKDLFWDECDCVMQLHPPKAEWINCHPYCLHLWRPTGGAVIPQPPALLVGF